MKTKNVDVYIYVRSKPEQGFVPDIVNTLSHIAGVYGVTINTRVKNLLSVKYDPDNISSGRLLATVKQSGHAATLVGM